MLPHEETHAVTDDGLLVRRGDRQAVLDRRAHRGMVSADSEGRGKGATFTVTPPIAALVRDLPRGFDEFLAKPIEPFDLVEAIARSRKSA